jgi:hypothetical protein
MFDRHQEKKPMTEEEARPENTQPGALQPDGQSEGQKSLTYRNNDILTGSLRFQQTREQKTMPDPAQSPKKTQTPKDARDEFLEIKKVLVGPEKKWCLPKVDVQALESSPKLKQPEPSDDCKSSSPTISID